jgi:hypothetical protein
MNLRDRITWRLLDAAAHIAIDIAAESPTPSPVAIAIAERCMRERARILNRSTPAPARDASLN